MNSRTARMALVGLCMVSCGSALAASKVQGRLLSDGITGRPAITPAGWEQSFIYVGQVNPGYGVGTRAIHKVFGPAGWFSLDGAIGGGWPAGKYSLFTFDNLGVSITENYAALSFSYRLLDLPAGSAIVDPENLVTPAHYSVRYNENEGFGAWGPEPWLWGTDFYQTFVATTPYITRVLTKLAGKGGDHKALSLNIAVYATNDGPPSTWAKISPTRNVFLDNNVDPIIHMSWVPYQSKEMLLEVGKTYAARFWRDPSSTSPDFPIVARKDLNNGYAGGHLWTGNTARTDLDAYAYISGGQEGTIVNHVPVGNRQRLNPLLGFNTRHGQTFVASGSSVAAVDLEVATGANPGPNVPITFQVYSAVGGSPIGPSKRSYCVPDFFLSKVAAFWEQGQAPTTPGNTYYIEWTSPGNGVNLWATNENLPGEAYLNRVAQTGKDVRMGIAEYEGEPPPPPVADFVGTPTSGHAPLNVAFTDQTTGVVSQWTWNFGDSFTSTSQNPGHTYAVPGSYTVSLTVLGAGGPNTKTKTAYIVVNKNIGDYNDDGDVDQQDFGKLQACYTGAGNPQTLPACLDARLDGDDDVDLEDFAIFQGCMSGANIPANPACAP